MVAVGMDLVKHDEPAYPVEAWMEEQYYVNGAIVPLAGNPAGKPNLSTVVTTVTAISY